MANPQPSPQPAPLQIQGGVTKERVIPSFKKTVVDVDPTEWGNLPDTDKTDVGNEFFKTHYESDPDWASLAPEDQDEVRQTFYKNNQLPSQQDTNFFGDLANHVANAASGYTQDDLIKNSGQGVGSFIGDALSGLGYAGGGTLAGGALGTVVPVIGNVAGAIGGGIAGAASGGTLQDLQSQRIEGQQNPNYGRALGSGAIQGALQAIPVVGQGAKLLPRALANAGIQGAGGAVGSYGQQALEQGTFTPNVDLERLKREAAFGAGGGTVGAVLHKQPKAPIEPLPQAKVKGFEYAQAIGKRQGGKFSTRDIPFEQANKKLVTGIKQSQSVNEQQTLQGQLRKLKKQVEILDSVGRDENAPHYTRQTAKKLKEQTTAEYTKAQGEYNSKYQPVKQQKKVLSKQQSEQAVKAGIRARGKGGRVAAQYENYLSTVHPDSKRIVNAEIKARQGKVKAQASVEKERAEIRREKGKAKAQEINKTRDEQRRETVKQQNDLIRNEKKNQQAEEKASKKADKATSAENAQVQKAEATLKKQPPVLDNADIEKKSNELIGHVQKNEKGSLDAKLAQYRKAAKEDLMKYGLSKERGQAINQSYQKLLDAYAQKKTASTEKPSASTLKAGQEANRLELSKLNETGGKYNPGDANAKQRPAKGLSLEDAQRTREWDGLDEDTQRKAKTAMEAAEGDSDVIIEYDAEKSGDTGQFKLKTVSPLSLDFVNDRLVMHATNTNGHTGMYYLSPSSPNAKTGFASFTHEVTPLDETIGKAKKGLDANIYWGQRDVPTSDILARPKRETAGYTSELEQKLRNAYGQDANQLKRTLEKRIKKKEKVSPQEITNDAPKLQDDDLEGVYETMDKSQKKENWEEKTGDDC